MTQHTSFLFISQFYIKIVRSNCQRKQQRKPAGKAACHPFRVLRYALRRVAANHLLVASASRERGGWTANRYQKPCCSARTTQNELSRKESGRQCVTSYWLSAPFRNRAHEVAADTGSALCKHDHQFFSFLCSLDVGALADSRTDALNCAPVRKLQS